MLIINIVCLKDCNFECFLIFQILTLLVEAGSNVNIVQKQDNHTALHEAVCQHYEAAVRLLIENGEFICHISIHILF